MHIDRPTLPAAYRIFNATLSILSAVVFLSSASIWAATESDPEGKDVEQKLREIEEKEKQQDAAAATGFVFLGGKARLHGLADLNYEYLDVSDVGDKDSDSSSDFFVSSLAAALELFFTPWIRGDVAAELEDFGREGGNGKLRLDEAIFTLRLPHLPLYFVGGKTVLPFGGFEDHLIEGTLTEDLYEIDEWGGIAGFSPDVYGLDLSFSLYRRPTVIDNLLDFNTHDYKGNRGNEDRFRSWIVRFELEPLEETLSISTFYDSEPGDGRRNRSVGAAATVSCAGVSLDGEYIKALARETGENGRENKETVWLIGLAFDVTETLELAARYENFDDGDKGKQDEVLQYRLMGGFNYALSEWARFSFEYRFSEFEREKDSSAADSQHMVQFQLGLEY